VELTEKNLNRNILSLAIPAAVENLLYMMVFITDTMFMAAAKALAAMSPARNATGSNLLPPVTALREVSIAVALATALQARKEGLTDLAEDKIEAAIHAKMWSPMYLPYARTNGR